MSAPWRANKSYTSLHYALSANKLTKGNHPGATPHKSKGIQSVFKKASVSVQPFLAEELPETVEAWQGGFLTELWMRQPLLFFIFASVTV